MIQPIVRVMSRSAFVQCCGIILAAGGLAGCSGPVARQPASRGPAGGADAPASASAGVLLLLAHPDDETMIGAALGRLKERGVPVAALYVTRGEGGKLVVLEGDRPVETDPDDSLLAHLRTREMEEAARHFAIRPLVLLEHPDRPFEDPATGQPTRDVARFLASGVWPPEALARELAAIARRVQPEVVITLRPDSPMVHAHHQAIGRLALERFRAGGLGGRIRQIYGITEVGTYPAERFTRRPGALRVGRGERSARLGMTYGAFAHQGRRLHRSQLIAHRPASPADEELVPLGPVITPDPLARLLGLDAERAGPRP